MKQDEREKSSESVRSVERAIALIEALNRRPLSTLQDLHRDTGLPKPSLVRLLRTLEAGGLVTQTGSYGAYRLLGRTRSLSEGFPHEPLIVDVAESLMIEFTRREGWPLAFGMPDIDAIVVRASTIPHTSLTLAHSTLGLRLSFVGYALGRAFLAHCSPSEQKAYLDVIRRSTKAVDKLAQDVRTTKRMLKQVREQGYATRDTENFPLTGGLAVPVFERGRLVGSLGMTWLSAAMPMQQALDQYVPLITAVARNISQEIESQRRAHKSSTARPTDRRAA